MALPGTPALFSVPALLAVLAPLGAPLEAQLIPPRAGLVLNYSHKQTDREYDKEFVVTIEKADSNETIFRSYFLEDAARGRTILPDTVSRREWLGARAIHVGSGIDSLERARNRTIMALSRRAYQQLKRDRRLDEVATFVIMVDANEMYRVDGSEELVGAAPETLAVVIDGQARNVAALHVRGHYSRLSPHLEVVAENWYLDDPDAAWVLRIEQVVSGKTYHVRLGTAGTSPPNGVQQLDAALGSACRASMYGIYFAYNSAALTSLSEPTLRQVATVLKQHTDWSVTIEGHTDSIGGAKYNRELAGRRATAVKERLVQQYGIATSRLSAAGIGLARPLTTNATLEGRARNRRVELVRACGRSSG
ncbi:MAG TPA: OmpA family protein [Gemmatimonadaceae bacterium]|nr:OmpA family protein [Gemmatimonadaceae bacterium]